MKVVIQRVSSAQVEIDNKINGKIDTGLMVLLGIKEDDNEKIIDWMINKILNLRIFGDDSGKMNLSVKDVSGGILIISNFTLYGNAKKGFRPSYTEAAKPEKAEELYNIFIEKISLEDINIQTGIFGASMNVSLVNDGPVTIIVEK